jgi:hypothetical protein
MPDDNNDDDDGDENDGGGSAAGNGGSGPTQHYPASIVMRNTQLKAGTWLNWIMVQWQGCSVAEATWETDLAFYQQHYPDMLAMYNNGRVPERVVGAKLWYHPITGGRHYKVLWEGSTFTTMERDIDVQGDPAFTNLLADFQKRHQRGGSATAQLRQTGLGSKGQRRPAQARDDDRRRTDEEAPVSNQYSSVWASSTGARSTPTSRRTNDDMARLSHKLSWMRLGSRSVAIPLVAREYELLHETAHRYDVAGPGGCTNSMPPFPMPPRSKQASWRQ